jgi:hypothetical protein
MVAMVQDASLKQSDELIAYMQLHNTPWLALVEAPSHGTVWVKRTLQHGMRIAHRNRCSPCHGVYGWTARPIDRGKSLT